MLISCRSMLILFRVATILCWFCVILTLICHNVCWFVLVVKMLLIRVDFVLVNTDFCWCCSGLHGFMMISCLLVLILCRHMWILCWICVICMLICNDVCWLMLISVDFVFVYVDLCLFSSDSCRFMLILCGSVWILCGFVDSVLSWFVKLFGDFY